MKRVWLQHTKGNLLSIPERPKKALGMSGNWKMKLAMAIASRTLIN